ncbi:hypothetical protein VNO77_15316 [Canavalia gladiata]|uniref:Uncharacterized protein n=1 Tax=Canavalia gladiata TaxID=3824 RepID=A0AAN9QSB1_CANGL
MVLDKIPHFKHILDALFQAPYLRHHLVKLYHIEILRALGFLSVSLLASWFFYTEIPREVSRKDLRAFHRHRLGLADLLWEPRALFREGSGPKWQVKLASDLNLIEHICSLLRLDGNKVVVSLINSGSVHTRKCRMHYVDSNDKLGVSLFASSEVHEQARSGVYSMAVKQGLGSPNFEGQTLKTGVPYTRMIDEFQYREKAN